MTREKNAKITNARLTLRLAAKGHKRERRPRRRHASHAAGVPQLADSLLAGHEESALGQQRPTAGLCADAQTGLCRLKAQSPA